MANNPLANITKLEGLKSWKNGKNAPYQGVVNAIGYRLAALISLQTLTPMTTRTNQVNLGCSLKNEELSKVLREMKILRFNGGPPR
jgi:hypothetical protein